MKINQKYYSIVVDIKYRHTDIADILFREFHLELLRRGKHFRLFMKWLDKNNIVWN